LVDHALCAVAILTTRALPRWIGWLGLHVGALAGWLGLLSPASSVISGISSTGFIGFFGFMLTWACPAPAPLKSRASIPDISSKRAELNVDQGT